MSICNYSCISIAYDIYHFFITQEVDVGEDGPDSADRNVQEWMLICQNNAQFEDAGTSANEDVDWSLAGEAYPDLHEMPSFIDRQRQDHSPQSHSTAADPGNLQGQ